MNKENVLDMFMSKINAQILEEGIKKLNSIDLETISLEDLRKEILNILKIIIFDKQIIPVGQKMYRARVNDDYINFYDKIIINKNTKKFNNVSEIINRKAEDIKDYGRANIPGVSSFYCSSNLRLACGEVIQDAKHSFDLSKEILTVTVGEWVFKKPLLIAPLIYNEEVIKVRKDAAAYVESKKTFLKSKFSDDSINIHETILKFFSDQFSKKNIKSSSDYKISALYSKLLYDINKASKNWHYDGILYPSVIANFKGTNISLFDDDLFSKIELQNVYKVMCANVDLNSADPKFGVVVIAEMESIDELGKINWKTEFKTYK